MNQSMNDVDDDDVDDDHDNGWREEQSGFVLFEVVRWGRTK